MKRIVYIVDTMAISGGISRVVSQKASWLARHGYDVTILTTEGSSTDSFFPLAEGVKVVPLDVNFLSVYQNGRGVMGMLKSGRDRIKKNCLFAQRCSDFLCSGNYDVVFTTINNPGIFSGKDGSRKVYEFHFSNQSNVEFQQHLPCVSRMLYRFYYNLQNQVYKRYDALVLLTERDCKLRARQLHDCLTNVRVIPNFVTVAEPDRWPDYDTKRVISVGRLSPQKNYYNLFDVWALVKKKHPDWRLDIYGHGYGREEEHRAGMRRVGVDDVVEIHAPVSDIQSEYLASSIYVMSSRYEGFGLVLPEAMTCGLPCVAYDCPCGPAEIIRHGEDGLVVARVDDTEGMAAALCRLIEHREEREAMGHVARRNVRRYNIDCVMPRWVELIEELSPTKSVRRT